MFVYYYYYHFGFCILLSTLLNECCDIFKIIKINRLILVSQCWFSAESCDKNYEK